jgi:3-deoxy-D-manno-octulosonate 8-phosphate phosphatase (KDO 8-P phosphatase)
MLLEHIDAEVLDRARQIRLAVFDVDGVLTDGGIQYDAHGVELKRFHSHDGLGIKLLRDAGIEVALLSARSSRPVDVRAAELGLRYVEQGCRDKAEGLRQLARRVGVTLDQIAYTGDDWPDLPALAIAGLSIAVANADRQVLQLAHHCTERRGGAGAVRDVAELLLLAQGQYAVQLARFRGPA